MRIARFALATVSALALSAPLAGAQARRTAPAAARDDDLARLRTAIESAENRAAFSFNRGDIAGFIRAYADDIWVYPPNDQPFQGPDAALDYFRRSYNEGVRNLQLTTTGVDRSGSMAYETGIYTIDVPTTPAQPATPARDNGKYVVVWKRDNRGEWRMHVLIWSSNNPPRPMAR
jgi:ketosteroid isomerase-like protein